MARENVSRRSILKAAALFDVALPFAPAGPVRYEVAAAPDQDNTPRHSIRFSVIGLDHNHINGITDTSLRRINFDLGSSTKIGKWFTWNLSVSDRYLNHPVPGRKTNDLLYTTGLGITFAR